MVPNSPSWGNRAGRRLRIADDLSRGQLSISWWEKSNTESWTETPVNKQSRTVSGIVHPHLNSCFTQTHSQHNTYPSSVILLLRPKTYQSVSFDSCRESKRLRSANCDARLFRSYTAYKFCTILRAVMSLVGKLRNETPRYSISSALFHCSSTSGGII